MGTTSSKSKYSTPTFSPMTAAAPALGGAGAGGGAERFAAFQSPTLRFRAIADHYTSVEQVQEALRQRGLESSNLIVAVDFTKSNEWTGKQSFQGRSLHAIGEVPSPYENAIGAIGRTLSAFDDDGLIPSYGFGDATTGDKSVFSFLPGDKPCNGLEQVLWRYRELCPYMRMAGPTSFAPAIRQACRIVEQSGNQYHILLLVADGQVSRSSDLPPGQHSEQEQDTINAIVEASNLPLSIVMVGVGDGPWDLMKDFDDALPERQFDNFQFVNFTDVMASTSGDITRREALFALRALMEVPDQYTAIQRLGLMSRNSAVSRSLRRGPINPPLDPPVPSNIVNGRGSGASASSAAAPYGSGKAAAACSGYAFAGGSGAAAAAPQIGGGGAAAVGSSGFPRISGNGGVAGNSGAVVGNGVSGRVSGAGEAAGSTGEPGPQPDPMFICPITQDIMSDPVIATDGYTYERSAITKWLQNKNVSPMTNQPMPGGPALIPNHGLRSAIMQWKQDNGLA